MIALYTTSIQGEICVRIPKRKGVGYCVSVFGGHHSNKNCLLFDEIKPDWAGDTTDIDGYLSISIKGNRWDKDFKEKVESVLDSLKKVFPFLTEFKELTANEFFGPIIIKN